MVAAEAATERSSADEEVPEVSCARRVGEQTREERETRRLELRGEAVSLDSSEAVTMDNLGVCAARVGASVKSKRKKVQKLGMKGNTQSKTQVQEARCQKQERQTHWLRTLLTGCELMNGITRQTMNGITRQTVSRGLSSPGRRRKAEEEAKNKAKTNPK